MSTSYRAFQIELYEEYLEEASFLYDQTRTLRSNPEISWRKIGEFEERLEAHVDGLVVGADLALDVCRRRAAEGDFGELFAAFCVFCRQNQRDSLLHVLQELDPEDTEKASAAGDGLKYELPDSWHRDFVTLMQAGDPKLAPILARAFGYRRVPCGAELLSAMKRCSAAALPEIVWALGRISYSPAKESLLSALISEEQPVRDAAALALTRMGDPHAIDYCLKHAQPLLPLALSGTRRAISLLTNLVADNPTPDAVIALGLLGDPASVPLLISRLQTPNAASALHCITGADLQETVFIPEEPEEDEPADRGDGRPFGTNVTRLSENPDDWNQWWQANRSRFPPGVPHRNGQPLSMEVNVAFLEADTTPHLLRQHCLEEMMTHFRSDPRFEIDTPVSQQISLLASLGMPR